MKSNKWSHQPTNFDIDLDDNVEFMDSQEQDEDLDKGLMDTFAKNLIEQADKAAARLKMSRVEREEMDEAERVKAVRRYLGRACQNPKDEDSLYRLLSTSPAAINTPIDAFGNTPAHYVANPAHILVNDRGDSAYKKTDDRQRAALESWAEVVICWSQPDAFRLNYQHLTPVDFACWYGPSIVKLLCQNDQHADDTDKLKAVARAVLMAGAGWTEETVTDDDVLNAIMALAGAGCLDKDCGFVECNFSLRSSHTFRQKIKEMEFSPTVQPQIKLLLLTSAERDTMTIQQAFNLLTA